MWCAFVIIMFCTSCFRFMSLMMNVQLVGARLLPDLWLKVKLCVSTRGSSLHQLLQQNEKRAGCTQVNQHRCSRSETRSQNGTWIARDESGPKSFGPLQMFTCVVSKYSFNNRFSYKVLPVNSPDNIIDSTLGPVLMKCNSKNTLKIQLMEIDLRSEKHLYPYCTHFQGLRGGGGGGGVASAFFHPPPPPSMKGKIRSSALLAEDPFAARDRHSLSIITRIHNK